MYMYNAMEEGATHYVAIVLNQQHFSLSLPGMLAVYIDRSTRATM